MFLFDMRLGSIGYNVPTSGVGGTGEADVASPEVGSSGESLPKYASSGDAGDTFTPATALDKGMTELDTEIEKTVEEREEQEIEDKNEAKALQEEQDAEKAEEKRNEEKRNEEVANNAQLTKDKAAKDKVTSDKFKTFIQEMGKSKLVQGLKEKLGLSSDDQ